jgi:GNAT superfamily N-acetyltransferase
MSGVPGLEIRPAKPADLRLILTFVRELADYEKLSAAVDASPEHVSAVLFVPDPSVFCDIAELYGEPAGFVIWFRNFSSFRGRHGIYLEDLFVRPAFRGKGIGKALMRRLALRCVREGWTRFEWAVLDWNKPSVDFYRSIGADVMDEWRICRLSGPALATFAQGTDQEAG